MSFELQLNNETTLRFCSNQYLGHNQYHVYVKVNLSSSIKSWALETYWIKKPISRRKE